MPIFSDAKIALQHQADVSNVPGHRKTNVSCWSGKGLLVIPDTIIRLRATWEGLHCRLLSFLGIHLLILLATIIDCTFRLRNRQ